MSLSRPPAETLGLAALTRACGNPVDRDALWRRLVDRVSADATDAGAFHDIATLLIGAGQRDKGLEIQAAAIADQSLYRSPVVQPSSLTVLALAAPGDFTANTPLDFLLEGSDIELITWRLTEPPSPADAPAHDLAFLAIGQSEEAGPLLAGLSRALAAWPGPVVNNDPDLIAGLTRDGVASRFADHPDVLCPQVCRVSRRVLQELGARLPPFPLIVRPLGTHAGHGMEKVESQAALADYLVRTPSEAFYVTAFIDYSGDDGLFRKLRVVFIDGAPFIAHMAVSEHWMVHYLNAHMDQSEAKRAEEASMMANFDTGFAQRHAAAFKALTRALPLDYFGIDCAETSDGRLLVFEADVAMIVHAMDPPALFPYKQAAMARLMKAFRQLLHTRSQVGPAGR